MTKRYEEAANRLFERIRDLCRERALLRPTDMNRMLEEFADARKEHNEMNSETRSALRGSLEYDATGQLNDANLSFDQAVMFSIARSLVQLVEYEQRRYTERR